MNTRNEKEIEKFSEEAADWWSPDSGMIGLLLMNAVRVPFVQDGLLSNLEERKIDTLKPLEGFRILDVGCGGGFLSEALARTGASVTGIDPSAECIQVATRHAALDPDLSGRLTYVCTTVEDLIGTVDPFDAVVCSEVIEHVENPQFLVESCTKAVKENGSLFFTTINKTFASYAGAIVVAEYILRFVPKGTHEWHKFVPPTDLQNMLEANGCETQTVRGFSYNPLKRIWSFTSWTSINYALHAIKTKSNK